MSYEIKTKKLTVTDGAKTERVDIYKQELAGVTDCFYIANGTSVDGFKDEDAAKRHVVKNGRKIIKEVDCD